MVLKFFDVVLKFELPNARVLNFPQNSAPSLIGLVLIIGDCVYTHYGFIRTTVNVSVLVVLIFSQNFSTNGPYVVLNFCKFSDYMVLNFEKKSYTAYYVF